MKLRYAPRAHADIAHIYRYIAQHNTNAATSIVRQIRSTSRLLAAIPASGERPTFPAFAYFLLPAIPILSITGCAETR
jgi:plasmid stabilization system protein ParE